MEGSQNLWLLWKLFALACFNSIIYFSAVLDAHNITSGKLEGRPSSAILKPSLLVSLYPRFSNPQEGKLIRSIPKPSGRYAFPDRANYALESKVKRVYRESFVLAVFLRLRPHKVGKLLSVSCVSRGPEKLSSRLACQISSFCFSCSWKKFQVACRVSFQVSITSTVFTSQVSFPSIIYRFNCFQSQWKIFLRKYVGHSEFWCLYNYIYCERAHVYKRLYAMSHAAESMRRNATEMITFRSPMLLLSVVVVYCCTGSCSR